MGRALVTIKAAAGTGCKSAGITNVGYSEYEITLSNHGEQKVLIKASATNSTSTFNGWKVNKSNYDQDFADSISVTFADQNAQQTYVTISYYNVFTSDTSGTITFTASYTEKRIYPVTVNLKYVKGTGCASAYEYENIKKLEIDSNEPRYIRLRSTGNSYSTSFANWLCTSSPTGFSNKQITYGSNSKDTTVAIVITGDFYTPNRTLDLTFKATYNVPTSQLRVRANPSNAGSMGVSINGGEEDIYGTVTHSSWRVVGEYLYGTKVSLSASPGKDFNFKEWSVNSTPKSTGSSYTFTIDSNSSSSGQTDCNAFFEAKPRYLLETKKSPSNITGLSVSGGGNYLEGAQVKVEASSTNDNYEFGYWEFSEGVVSGKIINAKFVTSDNPYAFNIRAQSGTATAYFVRKSDLDALKISISGRADVPSGAPGGDALPIVSTDKDTQTYSGSGNKEFRVTASISNITTGYTFTGWGEPDFSSVKPTGDVGFQVERRPNSTEIPGEFEFSVSIPDGEHSLYSLIIPANFSYDSGGGGGGGTTTYYNINVSANNKNAGTVSGGGSKAQGSSISLVATANTGYKFVNWTENGASIGTTSTLSFVVNGPRTIVANFEPIVYNINWVLGGGTFPSGYNVVKIGDQDGKRRLYNPTTMPYNNKAIQSDFSYFWQEAPTRQGYKFLGWKITGFNKDTAQAWYPNTNNYFKDENIFGGAYSSSGPSLDTSTLSHPAYLAVRYLQSTDGASVTFTALWNKSSLPAKLYDKTTKTWKSCSIKLRKNGEWVEVPIKSYKNAKWTGQ